MIRLSPQGATRLARIRRSRAGIGSYFLSRKPTCWVLQIGVASDDGDREIVSTSMPPWMPEPAALWFRDRVLEAVEGGFCETLCDLQRAVATAKGQAMERAAAMLDGGAVPAALDARQEGERLLAGWRARRRARAEDDEDAKPTAASYNPYGHTPFERAWEERHQGERHCGMTWHDMPGGDRAEQKLNWYLWIKGEFAVEDYPSIAPDIAARYRAAHPADARCIAV